MRSIYNPCELKISKEDFKNLTRSGTQWAFIDVSYYQHHNITQKYKINKKIPKPRMIFLCRDARLERLLGSYAQNLIIKCNYTYVNDNEIKMSLIPMALLQNMPLNHVEHIFNALFKKTEYYKLKIKEEKLLDTKNDDFFLTRFNAIRIFLSLYVSSKFRHFIRRLLDYQVTINYDVLDEIEPNEKCQAALISWIEQALKWDVEDFLYKLHDLTIKFTPGLRYIPVPENRRCKYDKIRNDTEGLIAKLYINMVQEKKFNPEYYKIKDDTPELIAKLFPERKANSEKANAFFTIEQARGVMFDSSTKFYQHDTVDDFQSINLNPRDIREKEYFKEDLRLTDYALLDMLEMGYFQESLRINNSRSLILVGYTCGENFDNMFPYQNIYTQLILRNLYSYCSDFWFKELKKVKNKYDICSSNFEDDNVKGIFIKISPIFLQQYLRFLRNQNYLDMFVSSEEFEFYEIYFRYVHHNTLNITSLLAALNNCTDIDDILEMIFHRWSYDAAKLYYEDDVKYLILQILQKS